MENTYNFAFPLYVRLDDGEVIRIESLDKVLYHLEAIDIENNEYSFWDADGRSLRVLIEKNHVSGFRIAETGITLQNAFLENAGQLGTSIDVSGTPHDIWARLENVKQSIPRRRGFLSRLFSRRTC